MKFSRIVSVFVVVAVAAGCQQVVMSTNPGKAPGATPPQLMRDAESGGLYWDHPSAFGPVPVDLQATGDEQCRAANPKLVATGYHALAKDVNGQIILGGGYYCELKYTPQ